MRKNSLGNTHFLFKAFFSSDSLPSPPKVLPPRSLLANLMRECSSTTRDLATARMIHSRIVSSGLDRDHHLGNQLVQMYLKCGSLADARRVLDAMPARGKLAWTAIISAYVHSGDFHQAIYLFHCLLLEGVIPDAVSFVAMLGALALDESQELATCVHGWIVESGLEQELIVANALMSMYSKRLDLRSCWKVFERMPERNVVSWTVMIASYARLGELAEAMRLFRSMQLEGVRPNEITFSSTLVLFSGSKDLRAAKLIHEQIVGSGFGAVTVVANACVGMLARCGDLAAAARVFHSMAERDEISWNVMINAAAEEGEAPRVASLFMEMMAEGRRPDRATFLSILSSMEKNLVDPPVPPFYQLVLNCIAESGYQSSLQVTNALVSFYGKCGDVEGARRVFRSISSPDVISCTALIAAFSQRAQFQDALVVFRRLLHSGVRANQVTFLELLSSCRSLSDGLWIHSQIVASGFQSEVDVAAALVEMYSGCGNLKQAKRAYNAVAVKNLVLCNVYIAANAQNGNSERALKLFWEMQQDGGFKPDGITLNAVLSACAHGGLVSQGCQYFAGMKCDYQLTCNSQHYSCLIDLLGRAGRLDIAEKVTTSMPFPPDQSVRMAFLGACRTHHDKERGSEAARRVLQLDPFDHSAYVALSHLHADQRLYMSRS
ncbi:hypothetical protein SELMODRAFT_124576 [Selaginella moellendorffii]|uniref:Pentacotripeptide-repeat region of PRORP domain-containing protein n=2 Tax=Selaginella moellendorffii TaxID=88036 RepID=D8STL0_SELML|nr:hypothetical protein SELMODRAFT_124576 [Selaginella moellendorffii]